ncbi:Beta-lactamase (Cephalosporinase) [Actinokineospora spheciospongiae]|uniref:Beta-lactamase (Cephalosporinase) n=1 Tax=Actinokineospora spheciospongiae TaxID=909613 RepID=W7IRY3_9PSEU|nr:serine hydrolase domain-containing protein [Actinokineospora spheciospongiae]EWC59487.1 Beta-lactamase (Cephalosporinase) [Actinokineospora spheciospongiae]
MAWRTRGGAAVLCLALVAATVAGSAVAVAAHPGDERAAGRFDLPQRGFAPADTVLRPGTPESVGLDPAPIRAAGEAIAAWTGPSPTTPLFPGAVSLLVHHGTVVHRQAVGKALRYADGAGTELPAEQQVPVRADTVFDLASVSKLFTSLAVMCLVEDGRLKVDRRVAGYLPEFGVNGKEQITVRQLLTHTSGLEPFIPLWRDWPDEPSRVKAVMDRAPVNPPGSSYVYSDLNLITLGVLVERLSGRSLDAFVADRITRPLGLVDTGYNPPASKLDRVAATEFQSAPPRGVVRGQVHDENAWSLGGVAGHAGVFSTAADLAVLGQAILNGGSYAGRRVLRPDTVHTMLTNFNGDFPGNDHGLGFELDQRWYMGGLSGPRTAGHTGFTGTSLVIDPASRSIAILLTNRVHPSRNRGTINMARERLASGLASAMAVHPRHGPDAWFAPPVDATTATLTTPPLTSRGAMRVRFDAFVDTEDTDPLALESSADGQTWRRIPLRAWGTGAPVGQTELLAGSGHRSWWTVDAIVPGGDGITLRWVSTTDSRYTGRGILLDGIVVTDGDRMLLNGEKEPHLMRPLGWRLQTR